MHEQNQATLVASLENSAVYPQGEGKVEHLQTHISHIFLVGDYAYKIKKPVNFGFLDFTDLARRKFYCQEEVRLNSRLAPHIYLDVVAITGTPEAPEVGGTGEPIEYAIRMNRFKQSGLLDRRDLQADEQGVALMMELAQQMAVFHSKAAVSPVDSHFGEPARILQPMLDNFDTMRSLAPDADWLGTLDEIEHWTKQQHETLLPLLEQRRNGFIRECHGDIHCANIVVEADRVTIFDGLEFNEDWRWIDTSSDVAFLVMDLESRGRAELAMLMWSRYLELTGDYDMVTLLSYYKTYRAMVRAKVSLLRLAQGGMDDAEHQKLDEEMRAYLKLALSYTQTQKSAILISYGISGTGKSKIGTFIGRYFPILQLRSDVERKRLFGIAPLVSSHSEVNTGIYTAEATAKTYDRLAELSCRIVRAGYHVYVDATFLSEKARQRFATLAHNHASAFVIVALNAPTDVLRSRVRARLEAGQDASEANERILEMQLLNNESLTEAEKEYALQIDTETPLSPEEAWSALEKLLVKQYVTC